MENQTRALSLIAAYAFGAEHGLHQQVQGIRDMAIRWDSSYTSSLRRGYMVELFERHGLFNEFKERHWAFGNTPPGETKRRRYLKIKQQYEQFLAGNGPEPQSEPNDDAAADGEIADAAATDAAMEFALEAHLRDFLARNLERIEPGLRLYSNRERSGVEFPVEGGRIDLLAVDGDGRYVVIELKLSRGRNRALGQLLYYMGWVDLNLGNGPCRGYIIASEIPPDLAVAVSRASGVRLARYRMSFAIEPL